MRKLFVKCTCCGLLVFIWGGLQAEDESLLLWRPVIAESPVAEEAAIQMLAEARAEENVQARLAALSVLLEAYPDFFDAWIEQGILRGKHGDLDGALADFKTAHHLREKDVLPLCNQAYVHILQGNLSEAKKDYEQAIELSPSEAILFNGLGYVLYLMKNYTKAIEVFDRAIYLDPVSGLYFQNRAKAHEALGHKRQAKKDRLSSKKLEGLQYVTEENEGS